MVGGSICNFPIAPSLLPGLRWEPRWFGLAEHVGDTSFGQRLFFFFHYMSHKEPPQPPAASPITVHQRKVCALHFGAVCFAAVWMPVQTAHRDMQEQATWLVFYVVRLLPLNLTPPSSLSENKLSALPAVWSWFLASWFAFLTCFGNRSINTQQVCLPWDTSVV